MLNCVRITALCLIALLLDGLAGANEARLPDARTLFDAGKYDQALAIAEAADSPEGLTLAAELLSAKVLLGYVDDAKDSAKQARKWAGEAVKRDPDFAEARVQYALAYGFETRSSSPFRAWRKKLPAKTFKAIQVVRERYPDDPRGDALLGAWHLGIVRKAGDKNARKWFEASEADGIKYYQAAIDRAPDDIVIASNFALILLAIDQDRFLDQAVALMDKIETLPPRNAVEREVKSRMAGLMIYETPEELQENVTRLLDGE